MRPEGSVNRYHRLAEAGVESEREDALDRPNRLPRQVHFIPDRKVVSIITSMYASTQFLGSRSRHGERTR